MTGETLLKNMSRPENSAIFAGLYGPEGINEARNRYSKLVRGLTGLPPADEKDVRVFTAAGRTELGGNHTDHNHGKVLAASIHLDAAAAVSPRQDNKVLFRSTGFPDVEVDLGGAGEKAPALDLAPREKEKGTTEALVRGIAAEFAGRGITIGGFTANADSTVLPGSGLSSSAAVEVLFGCIFNQLYGGGKFTPLELAVFGQKAENNYFGKPSGLMDQAACASGGVIAIDFKDPQNPQASPMPFDPEALGYSLCVVNTRGSHADLTPDYAAIPREMKAAARFFGKNTLSEIRAEQILKNAARLREAAGDRALLRALHFFNENNRVDAMKAALEKIKNHGGESFFQDYLKLVHESGDSSWELLQNVYSPKNPAEQGIPLALALTREFFHSLPKGENKMPGACRVHGGGFAGTIQVYLLKDQMEAYREMMETVFKSGAVTELRIRPTGTAELCFPG
ncbi:MAG: galactokinase [Treponema sp.]|jgi:galactokinase|nr:galactokinase [Treponema sp.]